MSNHPEHREVDLAEFLAVVVKRKWLLVLTTLVLLVLAAAWSFTTRPLYRATATILIQDQGTSLLSIQDLFNSGGPAPDFLGTAFNTQLKLLTSRSLAERVARRMNLASRPEFASSFPKAGLPASGQRTPAGGPGGKSAGRRTPLSLSAAYASAVLGGLKVTPVEETRLVEVSFTSPHAQLAADVVNALVEEFISYSVETRYEATRQTSEFLNEQIARFREDLSAKERELQRYGEEKKLLFLNDKESSVVSEFTDVNTAYTAAQLDRYNKEVIYRQLKDLTVDTVPPFVNNPVIQGLRVSYAQAKNEYDEKSKFYGPVYPEMIRLKARLDSLRAELETEIRKAVAAAETEYRGAVEKELSYQNLLEAQRTNVVRTNNNAILYNSLRAEAESLRTLLNSLVTKQNEALVSARLDGLRTSNIKIVDPALVPAAPFTPNTRRNLLMALLLGLFGGLGLVFFVEFLDNTVKGPEDAEKFTGLPSLGVIPYLNPGGTKKAGAYASYASTYGAEKEDPAAVPPAPAKIELINHLYPKFTIAEDFRTIRTSLQFCHAEGFPKVLSVTSSLPEEGKTAVVANLGVAFAQLENRVLLIDADLRKPRLHELFNLPNFSGLTSVLTGRTSVENSAFPASVPNVWVLPSGPRAPNPAELLNSSRMRELIEGVRDDYEVILIDTPPVLAVIDAVIVSALADGTIFVVQAGKTSRKNLARAVGEVRKSKAEVLGLVFNEMKLRGTSGQAYYHYYRYESADAETPPAGPANRAEARGGRDSKKGKGPA